MISGLSSLIGAALFAALPLGYQLDISRTKVPTLDTLKSRVDVLSTLGFTEFQLYTEHTFKYSKHETVWRYSSPMTSEEIKELDAYCESKGIELVPNQNSFAHFGRWLRHPEYNCLAEMPQGGAVIKPWGNFVLPRPDTLNPTDPRSLELVEGLYDELLPCFKSKKINVGCDEALEIEFADGTGRSHKEIAEKGAHRVYFEYLMKLHAACEKRGVSMMFWADGFLKHPEMVKELPENVVGLDWGYEATTDFSRNGKAFREAKRKFRVCPGTSAWGSLFGRYDNMTQNVDNAFKAAEEYGAEGILLADWGDGGHPQPWLVSLPALVYVSLKAKGVEAPTKAEVAAKIDEITGGKIGNELIEIGNLYKIAGGRRGNSTELYHMLVDSSNYQYRDGATKESVNVATDRYYELRIKMNSQAEKKEIKTWVKEDLALLDLLASAVQYKNECGQVNNFRAFYEPAYREIWLKQNRPGGLDESVTNVFGR